MTGHQRVRLVDHIIRESGPLSLVGEPSAGSVLWGSKNRDETSQALAEWLGFLELGLALGIISMEEVSQGIPFEIRTFADEAISFAGSGSEFIVNNALRRFDVSADQKQIHQFFSMRRDSLWRIVWNLYLRVVNDGWCDQMIAFARTLETETEEWVSAARIVQGKSAGGQRTSSAGDGIVLGAWIVCAEFAQWCEDVIEVVDNMSQDAYGQRLVLELCSLRLWEYVDGIDRVMLALARWGEEVDERSKEKGDDVLPGDEWKVPTRTRDLVSGGGYGWNGFSDAWHRVIERIRQES
jgi:hypothetical protein